MPHCWKSHVTAQIYLNEEVHCNTSKLFLARSCRSRKSGSIQVNFRGTWNLILNFFSLLILVVHTLSLKNPSDATLASLSISIYPRWRPRWRTIIREKLCDTENNVSNPFSFLNCCYEVGILLMTLACNQKIRMRKRLPPTKSIRKSSLRPTKSKDLHAKCLFY